MDSAKRRVQMVDTNPHTFREVSGTGIDLFRTDRAQRHRCQSAIRALSGLLPMLPEPAMRDLADSLETMAAYLERCTS